MGLSTAKDNPSLNHGASNKGILSPVPMRHLAPLFKTILALKMLFHTYLRLLPNLDPRKSQFGKYQALNNLVTRLSTSVWNLHPCFSSIATLKEARSLNPIHHEFYEQSIFPKTTNAYLSS